MGEGKVGWLSIGHNDAGRQLNAPHAIGWAALFQEAAGRGKIDLSLIRGGERGPRQTHLAGACSRRREGVHVTSDHQALRWIDGEDRPDQSSTSRLCR